MTEIASPSFKNYFFERFKEWEEQQPGRRSTYTAFAEYLSNNSLGLIVKQQYVSGWIKGEFEPGEKYAPVLAEFYGDDVYDFLDVDKPNPYLQLIAKRFPNIPNEKQRQLAEDAERYEVKNERSKKTSPKRKTSTNP